MCGFWLPGRKKFAILKKRPVRRCPDEPPCAYPRAAARLRWLRRRTRTRDRDDLARLRRRDRVPAQRPHRHVQRHRRPRAEHPRAGRQRHEYEHHPRGGARLGLRRARRHGAAGRGGLARGAVPALFGAARHRCDGPARHVLSRHGGDGAQRAGTDAQPLESGAERAGRPRLHAAAARIGRPSRRALPVDGAHRPARHMGVGDAAVRADARQRLRQHGHGARPHRRRPAAARTGHDRQPRRVVSHGRRHAHVQDRPVL